MMGLALREWTRPGPAPAVPFHRPPRILLAKHRNGAGINGAVSLCFEPAG